MDVNSSSVFNLFSDGSALLFRMDFITIVSFWEYPFDFTLHTVNHNRSVVYDMLL